MKIDVIIPTYKPDKGFIELLDMLFSQSVIPDRVIIANTEKSYWDSFVQKYPDNKCLDKVEVFHVLKSQFDHGKTRNEAMKRSDADICIVMTMDAIPANEKMIENLIKPLSDDMIAVSYARQLAYENSSLTEKLTRQFNYPDRSQIKTADDIEKLQIKAFFCSNVCCAYDKKIFDELNGFVNKTLFNEDMIYASKVLKNGYKISYSADACVYHSHEYSGIQQFKRNFDNGVSHAQYPEVFGSVKQNAEGMKMVKSVLKSLVKKAHFLSAFVYIWHTACKYLGFKLGCSYTSLPKGMVKRFTTNSEYFNS
jgi:rhamnosyltransferase